MKKTLKLKGMHCHSCEVLLSEALTDAGVTVLSADYKRNELVVDISSESKMGMVKSTIEKEGYSLE